MTEMNKLTNIIVMVVILILAVLLVFPEAIFAQSSGTDRDTARITGMERGKAHMGAMRGRTVLTAEQQEQIARLQKKFREDNADIIKQLITKNFDLNTIIESDNPDINKAKAVQEEISDLKASLAEKRIELYMEIRKINPDTKFGWVLRRGQGMRGAESGH
jgi:Spy/CpxP family protein refolding chaperone